MAVERRFNIKMNSSNIWVYATFSASILSVCCFTLLSLLNFSGVFLFVYCSFVLRKRGFLIYFVDLIVYLCVFYSKEKRV